MLGQSNVVIAGFLPRVDTWEKRIMSFGSGEKQENYQAEMAKRAVANGFLFGKGPRFPAHIWTKILEKVPTSLLLYLLL